jgi:hypothetical protein
VDREHQQEWHSLEQQACGLLRDGDWYLRLAVLPSFTDPHILGLRGWPRGSSQVIWRRWRRDVDAEKLRNPVERLRHPRRLVPTIEEKQSIFDAARARDLVDGVSKLSIPVIPQATSIGLDGTGYELLAKDGNHSINLRWREAAPREWLPIMKWFEAAWRDMNDAAQIPQDVRINELPWNDPHWSPQQ